LTAFVEGLMSKSGSAPARPIPTGVLVSVSKSIKHEKPKTLAPSTTATVLPVATLAPPEPAEPRVPRAVAAPPARQAVPLWLVAGASGVWVVAVLTVLLCVASREGPAATVEQEVLIAAAPAKSPATPPAPVKAVVLAKAPEPVPAPRPLDAEEVLFPMEPAIIAVPAVPALLEPGKPEVVVKVVEEVKPVVPAAAIAAIVPIKPARKSVDLNIYQSCQQIGSDVQFFKDPPEAFKKARAEKKLIFLVHLSGNLEDPGFT
jgi:hypothetical protein